MTISIGGIDSAYALQQASALSSAVRSVPSSSSANPTQPVKDPSSSNNTNLSLASGGRKPETPEKQRPAETPTHPGYTFEVDQQNHRIMKVSNSRGVLIYQVPSKGELALVEAEEANQKRLLLTA